MLSKSVISLSSVVERSENFIFCTGLRAPQYVGCPQFLYWTACTSICRMSLVFVQTINNAVERKIFQYQDLSLTCDEKYHKKRKEMSPNIGIQRQKLGLNGPSRKQENKVKYAFSHCNALLNFRLNISRISGEIFQGFRGEYFTDFGGNISGISGGKFHGLRGEYFRDSFINPVFFQIQTKSSNQFMHWSFY